MRGLMATVLLAAAIIAGCGGTKAANPALGCHGIHTPAHPQPLTGQAAFDAMQAVYKAGRPMTVAYVCSHFGRPRTIDHDSHGRVSWTYPKGGLTFEGD